MPLLSHHVLPTGPNELAQLPGGAKRWDDYIRRTLADAAANLADLGLRLPDGSLAAPRFFDACVQAPAGPQFTLPILWNAFPKRLLSRFGRTKALQVADVLWPRRADPNFDPQSPAWHQAAAEATLWVRPQDEYCEWRVERDPQTQDIRRVVFTTEAPEYWMALHGRTAMDSVRGGSPAFRFQGDPQRAAAAYSALLGQTVTVADLQWKPGAYNAYNRWNTTDGIVHLTHDVNSLCTHVRLIADSLVSRCRPEGRLITHPEALCSAQDSGDPNNHSDPTIVSSVNALARLGAWLTLAEPVGVCIDSIDTSGWELPGNLQPVDLLCCQRGAAGSILRLVVQAPAGSAVQLDQLKIDGEPLRHGGQIAECITVKATAICVLPGDGQPLQPLPAVRHAGLADVNRHLLHLVSAATGLPAGHTPAFAAPAAPPGPGA